MLLRPIAPGDLAALAGTAAEVMARPYMAGAETLPSIANDPYARVMELDGVPVAAAGLADCGHGVALAWAVFAQPVPKRAVLPLIRALLDTLLTAPFHWIEAQTPLDLPSGLKLDRMLGFEPVNAQPFIAPNGRAFQRFRFVKGSR